LFSYYAVVNLRQNPRWVTQVREAYVLRRENLALRPPRTYVEQTRLIERNVTINREITVIDHRTVAMPLHRLAADPIAGRNLRLVRVNEAERQQLRQQAAQLHEFREQRVQQERAAARGGPGSGPRTLSLPHSPIAAHHPTAHPGGAGAHAAVPHRPEWSHPQHGPAVSQPAVAHRPEPGRPAARELTPRPGGARNGAAELNRVRSDRPAPAAGAGFGARRPPPGSPSFRPRPRPETSRPDPRREPRAQREEPR
jgi:hypothetical protein